AFTKFAGFDYTVQRVWSNRQASAGHDPCQPALPGEVYFNASPVMTDTVDLGLEMGKPKGVAIPLGQSKTIAVDLFSDGPTSGPWTVSAENAFPGEPYLGFSLDETTGANGDRLMLTITLLQAPPHNFAPFFVKSSLNGHDNYWIGFASDP